jgi:hypothetical protein
MRFTEIEHKFVVGAAFDLAGFGRALDAMGPLRHSVIRVRDRYFLTEDGRRRQYVIRHRCDHEIHQLTLKSVETDPAVRDEISLDLGHHAGDQAAQVDAFVGRMGVSWSGELQKDLRVWYFPDCEVVHYVASGGAREVRCVEFEATQKTSVPDALAVLDRYERALGFDPSARSRDSLVHLVFPDAFPR